MHLPPPGLPRFGGGERPPFSCKPPAPLTITMGQRPCTLQAANQKVFTFLPHSPPPPRRGQGWWFAVLRSSAAAIKMRRRLFLSPSACSTEGFFAEKFLSYPAQLSVKGVCKGESLVSLCPVLLPFAGAKGRPLRRAVLTMPLQKAPRRRQARKIVIKEGGTYGKEKRTGEGPGRPVPG